MSTTHRLAHAAIEIFQREPVYKWGSPVQEQAIVRYGIRPKEVDELLAILAVLRSTERAKSPDLASELRFHGEALWAHIRAFHRLVEICGSEEEMRKAQAQAAKDPKVTKLVRPGDREGGRHAP